MWNRTYQPWFAIALITLAACADGEALNGPNLLVLEGGSVFTGTSDTLLTDAVVVLEGPQIRQVGRTGEFQYGPDVTVIDVRGRYIVPGLIDMHAHVPGPGREEAVRYMLSYGVTTARSPGVVDSLSGIPLRDALARGELPGPRLITGGAFINGLPGRIPGFVDVSSEDAMRTEVRRQKAQGVDLVKLYWDVTPSLVRAAVEEAHILGISVAGHMRVTSWTEAAQLGISSLEHSGADGPTWELVEDPQLRERLRGQDPPRVSPNVPPATFYDLVSDQASVIGPRMDSLVTALVANDVTVVPTLVIMQTLYFGDDPNVWRRLEAEGMPPTFLSSWDGFGPDWRGSNPFVVHAPVGKAQELLSGKAMFPFALKVVRTLHERGVRVTTGTDLGMPWVTPGVALHRELELLVEAGISSARVLHMATRAGADALGLSDQLGTIEPGKIADLLILQANPLTDIRNTRSIEAVYHLGIRFAPDSLRFRPD